MRDALRTCCRWIDRWSGWWTWLAGLLAVGLAVLVVVLVLLRYCFSWTHNGLDELRWHLFGAIFLLALAGCLRDGGHVRVDLVSQRLPVRARAVVDLVLTLAVLLPFCVIMVHRGGRDVVRTWSGESGRSADHWATAWSGGDQTSLTYRVVAPVEGAARATVLRGERSDSEGGLEARWLARLLIPLGFVLLGIQGLAHALRQVLVLAGDGQAPPAQPQEPL